MGECVDELQRLIGCTEPVMELKQGHICASGVQKYNTWVFQLWKWMIANGISIKNIGPGLPLKRRSDMNLVEYVSKNAKWNGTRETLVEIMQLGCYGLNIHRLSDLVGYDGSTLSVDMIPNGRAQREYPEWYEIIRGT